MSKFVANDWFCILDFKNDEYSKKQVEVAKKLNLDLKGAVLCHEEQNTDSEICKKYPAFPTFCNTETNICVSGFRSTMKDFEDLQKISRS